MRVVRLGLGGVKFSGTGRFWKERRKETGSHGTVVAGQASASVMRVLVTGGEHWVCVWGEKRGKVEKQEEVDTSHAPTKREAGSGWHTESCAQSVLSVNLWNQRLRAILRFTIPNLHPFLKVQYEREEKVNIFHLHDETGSFGLILHSPPQLLTSRLRDEPITVSRKVTGLSVELHPFICRWEGLLLGREL